VNPPQKWRPTDEDGNVINVIELLGGFPERALELAQAAGVEIGPGLDGVQFYDVLQQAIVDVEDVLDDFTRWGYVAWRDQRTGPTNEADRVFGTLLRNRELDEAWRNDLDAFIKKVRIVQDQAARGNRRVDITEVMELRQDWNRLLVRAEEPETLRQAYDRAYRGLLGPLDWVPPEPRSPFDGEELISDAYLPNIELVVDGDTLRVRRGNSRPRIVRLLGVDAAERSTDEGIQQWEDLKMALLDAAEAGTPVYLVNDPDQAGSYTDQYGRELAWLFIGDTPWYFPERLRPGGD
jgi:hypothetical protein